MTEYHVNDVLGKLGLAADIVKIALDCPACRGQAKELIQNYKNGNHLGGGLSTDELTEERTYEYRRDLHK